MKFKIKALILIICCILGIGSCSVQEVAETATTEVDPIDVFTINVLDNYTYVSTITTGDQVLEVVECTVCGPSLGFHSVETGRDAWVIRTTAGDYYVISRLTQTYKSITQEQFLAVVAESRSALFPYIRKFDITAKEALAEGVKIPFDESYSVFDYNGNILYDVNDIFITTYQFQDELNMDLTKIPEGYTEE